MERKWVFVDAFPSGQARIDNNDVVAIAPAENGSRIFLSGGGIIHVPGTPDETWDQLTAA